MTSNEPEPASTRNTHRAVWDSVMDDIRERDELGEQKYGTRLQAHNGRNPLIDAYQEALDLVVYLKQAIQEQCEHKTLRGNMFCYECGLDVIPA